MYLRFSYRRMITDKIKELEAFKSKVAELEKTVAGQLDAELAALPAAYGFDSVQAFARAVAKAARTKPKKPTAKRGRPPAAAGKRKRARITPEIKAEVKAAAEAGKTGAAIAKEFGISLPSVQNIKKEFGLVKSRG